MPVQPIVAFQPEVGPVVSVEGQKSLKRFYKFHSPQFSGGAFEDAQGFLDQFNCIMCTLGLV